MSKDLKVVQGRAWWAEGTASAKAREQGTILCLRETIKGQGARATWAKGRAVGR